MRREVDHVAALVKLHPDFDPCVPGYELDRLLLDDGSRIESRLRDAVGSIAIQMFHATRLLPSETERIVQAGLHPLTRSLRTDRLAVAVEEGWLHSDEASLLDANGPLAWSSTHSARMGQVWGFVPLQSIANDPSAFFGLLGVWGGESISWSSHQAGEVGDQCKEILGRLTAASVPTIVELAVPVANTPVLQGTLVCSGGHGAGDVPEPRVRAAAQRPGPGRERDS